MRAIAAAVVSVAVMTAAAATVLAHPMTYKGTVVSVEKASVQLKAIDDMTKKEVTKTFKVTEKTKVLRGDTVVTFTDAKVQKGERIAITINMDTEPDLALEIRLAAVADSAAPAAGGPAPMAPMAQMDHANMAGKSMTVTGCVAAGSKTGSYTMTNGMMAGEKTGKSYDLMGGTMKPHVGHKVAVTGTVEAAKMTGGDKAMSKEQMAAMPSVLRVKSVKMIAATCS